MLLVPRRREITAIPREHQSRSGFLALLVGLPERRKCLGMPAMRVYRTLPPRLSLAPHCQVLLAVASGFAAQWLRTAPALTLRDVLLLPDQRSAIMSLASFRWWKFPPQGSQGQASGQPLIPRACVLGCESALWLANNHIDRGHRGFEQLSAQFPGKPRDLCWFCTKARSVKSGSSTEDTCTSNRSRWRGCLRPSSSI